jgi:hypothetical protein
MLHQKIFEKLNLASLDSEACKKYLTGVLKDDKEWLDIHTKAVDHCLKEMSTHIDAWQKAYEVTKEECDAKYAFMTDCMDLYVFMVSSWYINEIFKYF